MRAMPGSYHEWEGGRAGLGDRLQRAGPRRGPAGRPPGLWRLAVCQLFLLVLLLTEVAAGLLAL